MNEKQTKQSDYDMFTSLCRINADNIRPILSSLVDNYLQPFQICCDYKALCLLLYDSRKYFPGNAVSLMERGTPSSDNQESFFACLIVVKNDSVFHSRNLYNVEFERVSS